MADIVNMLSELKGETARLEERFLASYMPANPDHDPATFEYDVKAYTILAHAALEEFFERVSESMMEQIENDLLKQKVGLPTACLMMAYKVSDVTFIEEDEKKDQDSCFTSLRKAVREAKTKHAAVLMDNHGLSLKYLRRILTPVGLNVNADPEVQSLKTLALARGSFAHSLARRAMYGEYRRAHKVLTPEEALEAVKNCLSVCQKLADDAQKVIAA